MLYSSWNIFLYSHTNYLISSRYRFMLFMTQDFNFHDLGPNFRSGCWNLALMSLFAYIKIPWRIMNQMKGATKHADNNKASQPSVKALFCVWLFLINKGVISYCNGLEQQCYITFTFVVVASNAVLILLAKEEKPFRWVTLLEKLFK